MPMLPRSSADILATAKPPPSKATRKRAKPQPPPSFSTQITTFPSTDSETTEMAEPTPPISQLPPFTLVGSSHSIGGVHFQPILTTQDFLKDFSTQVDSNEGETCSYDCDEETMLEFMFSFLLHEIVFSLALHLIQNLNRNLRSLKLNKSWSFYKRVISVRSTLS
jgi:hypothetical protein